MSQKLQVDISEFDKIFIKTYNEESDGGYFFGIDIQYLEHLHNYRNDLRFLTERIKIEKFEELVANLHNKTEYVIDIRNLKQAPKHRLS